MVLIAILHLLFGVIAYRGVCNPSIRIKTRSIERYDCPENQTIYDVLSNRELIRDINEFQHMAKYDYSIEKSLNGFLQKLNFKDVFSTFERANPKSYLLTFQKLRQSFEEITLKKLIKDNKIKYEMKELLNAFDVEPLRQVHIFAKALEETYNRLNGELSILEADAKTICSELLVAKGYEQFEDFLKHILADIEKVFHIVRTDGEVLAREFTNYMDEYSKLEMMNFADRAVWLLRNVIGSCPQTSFRMRSTYRHLPNQHDVNASCHCIADSLNYFWYVLVLCLMLFPLLLPVLFYLALLYRRECRYGGTLEPDSDEGSEQVIHSEENLSVQE